MDRVVCWSPVLWALTVWIHRGWWSPELSAAFIRHLEQRALRTESGYTEASPAVQQP